MPILAADAQAEQKLAALKEQLKSWLRREPPTGCVDLQGTELGAKGVNAELASRCGTSVP
jgi:hypothetical protein